MDIIKPQDAIEYYKNSIKAIEEMDLPKEEKMLNQMMFLIAIKAVIEVNNLDKE